MAPFRSKASRAQLGNRYAKTAYERKQAAAASSVSVADGTARAPVPTALALVSPATRICVCIAPSLIAAIAFCVHAPRPLQMSSPHALPHAHRADRLSKNKTQGKRNLPDNEAVTKWRIIETLERATPAEIVP